MANVCWWFFFSKIIELLDTVNIFNYSHWCLSVVRNQFISNKPQNKVVAKKIVYSILLKKKYSENFLKKKKHHSWSFFFFNRCSLSCARSLIRWPSYTCITTVLWYIIGGSGSNTLQGVNVSVVHSINIINCQYKA